jgi:hypothetical protein
MRKGPWKSEADGWIEFGFVHHGFVNMDGDCGASAPHRVVRRHFHHLAGRLAKT